MYGPSHADLTARRHGKNSPWNSPWLPPETVSDDPYFNRDKYTLEHDVFDRTAKIHVKGMLQARCRPRTGCKQLQEVVKVMKILKGNTAAMQKMHSPATKSGGH